MHKTFMRIYLRIISLALLLIIVSVETPWAQTDVEIIAQHDTTDSTNNNEDAEEPARFAIYKPSFVMWSVPENRKDEQGLQIRLSAKYDFLTCSNSVKQENFVSESTCSIFNVESLKNTIGTFNVFFSYTTDFDFYITSDGNQELRRNSRPVRNRMTSPGLHLNWAPELPVETSGIRYKGITWSLIHHSNGQDLEFDSLFAPESSNEEIRNTIADLADNNPSWTDGVSRGWNFVELSVKLDIGRNVMKCKNTFFCTQILAGIKIPVFTDPSNKIWWEPDNDADYRDYNLGSLNFTNEWGRKAINDPQFFSLGKKELSIELKCGKRACSTAAALRLNLNLGEDNFLLPLMLYGHFGRNEHIYNYHEKSNMFGIGLRFTR